MSQPKSPRSKRPSSISSMMSAAPTLKTQNLRISEIPGSRRVTRLPKGSIYFDIYGLRTRLQRYNTGFYHITANLLYHSSQLNARLLPMIPSFERARSWDKEFEDFLIDEDGWSAYLGEKYFYKIMGTFIMISDEFKSFNRLWGKNLDIFNENVEFHHKCDEFESLIHGQYQVLVEKFLRHKLGFWQCLIIPSSSSNQPSAQRSGDQNLAARDTSWQDYEETAYQESSGSVVSYPACYQ